MAIIVNNIPIGLDISDEALRYVKIKRQGRKNIIAAADEIRLPEGIVADGEIKDQNKFLGKINELFSNSRCGAVKNCPIISVLPEKKTFIKLIKMEAPPPEKLRDQLAKEITRHIPFDIDDINFDWQVIGRYEAGKQQQFLVGAAPQKLIDDYLGILKSSKLMPYALEIEAVAIARALINEGLDLGPKIIIDLGAIRTSLILYDKKIIQFSVSLPVSGKQITNKIADVLQISFKDADKAKIACGLDEKKCSGALKKVLDNTINNLVEKIEESIDFYHNHFQNKSEIKEIVLCGGGANLANLDKIILEKTNIPTIIGNPLIKIYSVNKSIKYSPEKFQSFITAIGLALRAYQNNFFI